MTRIQDIDQTEIELRADELEKDTALSSKQAEYWALQEAGLDEDQIGDEMGRPITTVRRIEKQAKKKIQKARDTLETVHFESGGE